MKNLIISAMLFALPLFSLSQDTKVCLNSIENKIQIGQMKGNKSLTFGFKNILLEYLQDKDYQLVDDCSTANYKIEVEILFLDVLKTNSGVSVFHKQCRPWQSICNFNSEEIESCCDWWNKSVCDFQVGL